VSVGAGAASSKDVLVIRLQREDTVTGKFRNFKIASVLSCTSRRKNVK
jgi:hypothetical protein